MNKSKKVKRWSWDFLGMDPDSRGRYVEYEDYSALLARAEAAEAQLKTLAKEKP